MWCPYPFLNLFTFPLSYNPFINAKFSNFNMKIFANLFCFCVYNGIYKYTYNSTLLLPKNNEIKLNGLTNNIKMRSTTTVLCS